jgi:hypothetical protein
MKTTLIAVVAILLCCFSASAQNSYTVKGTTVDTVYKTRLTSTVTILNAKDSILRKFTHAAPDGSFNLAGLPAGNYLLLVTYPDYADYVDGFTIDPAKKEYDSGNISMSPKSRILQEVIIKGTASGVKLKGDTTEFNAKAFVIQPNSKVEDLLKQVPGMEVDKDGKIKFQGEKVDKVLVDGEEFFGDDPTLVTKNIRGDMVDKLQVYDKKSDQATFTGIDDGVKIKTLNVKLKEDKKRGVFGKVTAGVGTDGYYEGQAMYNLFRAKEKFSVYGTTANDGKLGLGFAESSKLGTSSNTQISDDGGAIFFMGGGDDLDGSTYYGRGLPLARTGGVHYDGKWNNDKESINTNYKIGSLGINTDQHTTTQTNYGSVEQNRVADQNIYNYSFRQKLDATYQKTISPTANLKVDVSGVIRNSELKTSNINSITDGDGNLLNSEVKSRNDKGQLKTINAGLFYTKRFKKAGRTISWDANETYNEGTTNNYLKSDNYTAATATDSLTDQYKPGLTKSFVFNNNITYTEPITKTLNLTFNYGIGVNNSSSDQRSYNASAPGQYDILDPLYSNNYTFNQLTNQLGAAFNFRTAKTILVFGTKASAVGYEQVDQYTGNKFKRDFVNWRPSVRYQYKITAAKTFEFNYNGNNNQPSINQIQPIRTNNDVVNIVVGNPDLHPSFNNNVNLRYSSVQQLKNQYLSFYGNFGYVTNAIVNRTTYNATTGRSVSQYVNLDDKAQYNYNLSASFSKKLSSSDIYINSYISTNGNVYYNYIDNVLNQSINRSYYGSVGLQKNKAKKYFWYMNAGPNYNFNSTQGSKANNNSAGFNGYFSGTLYLPHTFQLSSDINYTYKAKTEIFPSQAITMWNASFSKTFLKENNLKLSISGNNLLDQLRNDRSQNNNMITQTSYNTIRRYFMFTVSWDFTKFGTSTNDKN